MKVLLIGATGATGSELLPLLLAAGHAVTAFVRSPEKVVSKSDKLNIVVGEVRDAAALKAVAAGQEAVLVAFGPRSLAKSDLQETLMRNLVEAVQDQGVRRIVNLSAWGAGTTASVINPVFKLFRMTLLRHVFDDKERGLKFLAASGLDYTNACPGRLLDAPARGKVRSSLDGKGIRPELTRADLAQWMIDQLTSPTWVRRDVIVGY
jgi:uncharacterized protein YbjT (DUF2867 family)